MRKGVGAALVAVIVVVGVACGTSGRAMTAPPPGATAPPRQAEVTTTTVLAADGGVVTGVFRLDTNAWTPGAAIPRSHTCNGDDTSPALIVANVPADAAELALIATGEGEVNWVVAGIDPATTTIEEGSVPAGAVVAASSSGEARWTGPCPPEGGGPRLYDITLYALSSPSGVTAGMETEAAVAAITDQSRVVASSVLTGTFSR